MGLGTQEVCHISFVVKDIEKTVKNWSVLLGIDLPRIWNIPTPEEAPALTNGVLEDYSDCRISVIKMKNITVEFVQPGQKSSPWKTWLEEHGEGFQHISFVVEDRDAAKKLIQDEFGVADWYHIGYYPGGTYAFYDTKNALGTEINIKSNDDNTAMITELLKGWNTQS
ncbi:MAG: VOC family protein [Lachnospiraceae bacterium]|nr:VOC family protein [Lachnospiraceae bacterium]